jgi:hypothetical protein
MTDKIIQASNKHKNQQNLLIYANQKHKAFIKLYTRITFTQYYHHKCMKKKKKKKKVEDCSPLGPYDLHLATFNFSPLVTINNPIVAYRQ